LLSSSSSDSSSEDVILALPVLVKPSLDETSDDYGLWKIEINFSNN
jgi:hypothetical protein